MADNITLGSFSGGATLKTDENASSEHYQRIKLSDGTADSDTVIAADNGTAANALRVTLASDSTGQVALAASSAVIGYVSIGAATTAAGDLAKAEDAPHSSGDVGVMMLAVRKDTPANLSGADGDYEPLQVSGGRLWAAVVGDAADDAVASGNPVLVGGVAVETDGTDPGAVSDEGDAAHLRTDMNRRLLVSNTHPRLFSATDNSSSAETDTELVAAPGAGLHLYITDIVCSALTAQTIKFVEDTSSAVDVVEVVYLPANGTAVMSFAQPIRLSENVNFGYTSTAAVAHSVLVNGYTAP